MQQSGDALSIKVLAGETRSSGIGTRLTYKPRNLLAECSFDVDEQVSDQEKKPVLSGAGS